MKKILIVVLTLLPILTAVSFAADSATPDKDAVVVTVELLPGN